MKNRVRSLAAAMRLSLVPGIAVHAAICLGELPPQMRFDLNTPPKTFSADAYRTNGVETIFYEGAPYRGRPTRVFAYYGVKEPWGL